MRSDAKIRLALFSIWLIPLLWAVNNLLARMAPGVVEPYTLGCMRWGIAGALLSLLARAELRREWRHIAQAWHQHLVLGFLGMVACGAWVYIGGRTTSATNIALIYTAAPALITLGSAVWLRERLGRAQWLGLTLAMAGVLHVIVQGEWARLAELRFVEGDLWILAGVVCWVFYALLQEAWRSPLGAVARLAVISWGAMPFLVAGSVWEMSQPGTPALGTDAVLMGLTAALLPGLMAYGLYGWSQQILGASKVASTLYLGPLYGALSAWWLLDESLGWYHLWGGALLLPGVYLASRPASAPPPIRHPLGRSRHTSPQPAPESNPP